MISFFAQLMIYMIDFHFIKLWTKRAFSESHLSGFMYVIVIIKSTRHASFSMEWVRERKNWKLKACRDKWRLPCVYSLSRYLYVQEVNFTIIRDVYFYTFMNDGCDEVHFWKWKVAAAIIELFFGYMLQPYIRNNHGWWSPLMEEILMMMIG